MLMTFDPTALLVQVATGLSDSTRLDDIMPQTGTNTKWDAKIRMTRMVQVQCPRYIATIIYLRLRNIDTSFHRNQSSPGVLQLSASPNQQKFMNPFCPQRRLECHRLTSSTTFMPQLLVHHIFTRQLEFTQDHK